MIKPMMCTIDIPS